MSDSIGNSSSTPPEPWGWTRSQRIVLGVLVFLFLVVLGVGYWRRPYRLDDPVVIVGGERMELAARVDPNVATVLELTRIPHVGEKLAGKIVEYRECAEGGGGGSCGVSIGGGFGACGGAEDIGAVAAVFSVSGGGGGVGAVTRDAAGQ